MHINTLLLFFAIFIFTGPCKADSEPLVVQLDTLQQLQPLFLCTTAAENSGFEKNYIEKLEQILQFDLSNSGFVQLLSHTRERTALANSTLFSETGIAKRWKDQNAQFVVKVKIIDKKMTASLLAVNENSLRSVKGFTLSGKLNEDRQQVHQLNDLLIKAAFGQSGIASSHLLFTRKYRNPQNNKWISELWESDYDGSNAHVILSEDGGYCVTPIYIPPKPGCKCSACFYVSYKNGQPKIYLASLDGTLSQKIISLRGNQLMPAVSQQRDKIAFISDITGNPDLFLQEFSPEQGSIGKPRQIYTTRNATQGSPTFSPDGKRLAFVSNKDGSPRIYVINIPSASTKLQDIKAQLITRVNRESTAPNWSPDGKKLAYCARGQDARQIWIYDFEEGKEWQLTQEAGNKENPSWAPDSLHLVYNSTGQEDSELFLINLNRPIPIKICDYIHGEKRFPLGKNLLIK